MSKRALMVCPDPQQWTTYNYCKDFASMRTLLENKGFLVSEYTGFIVRESFEILVGTSLHDSKDTFVLVFCGHGNNGHFSYEHGSMQLSNNEWLTSTFLNHCIRKYKGTFVTIAVACFMGGIPPQTNEPVGPGGVLARDELQYGTVRPRCKHIVISGTDTFDKEKGGSAGSTFIRNLYSLLAENPNITYTTLKSEYEKKFSATLYHPMDGFYDGDVFGSASDNSSAILVSIQGCKHYTCDDDDEIDPNFGHIFDPDTCDLYKPCIYRCSSSEFL